MNRTDIMQPISRQPSLAQAVDAPHPDDPSAVKWVNHILSEAIDKGASDIHFEPYETHYRVRFRQDGMLYEHPSPSLAFAQRIIARLKIMANLDISERRIPQDGRCKLQGISHPTMDLRVSTCPLLSGEKIVIRLLNAHAIPLQLSDLGLEPLQQQQVLKAMHRPHGLILVTGPTGSGKTMTLYSMLHALNHPTRNISSVEDPVEITLNGINQVQVHPKAGLTFASAMKAFLRQDPDIIMLGEIRDVETADIAIKAAQTGHLVLSTLHTNSAAETLPRLLHMGIPSYQAASALCLVVAQRLVRVLCNLCKKPAQPSHPYQAQGCQNCQQGYKGRRGLFEVMPISSALSELLLNEASAPLLLKQAQQEGMQTLRQSALHLVQQGVTSIEEMDRICMAEG